MGEFPTPTGLALHTAPSGDETPFVADLANSVIRRIDSPASSPRVTTTAGAGTSADAEDPGSAAAFTGPRGLAVMGLPSGGLVLSLAQTLAILAITYAPGGDPPQKGSYFVTTLAGVGGTPGHQDRDGNPASFANAEGIFAVPAAIRHSLRGGRRQPCDPPGRGARGARRLGGAQGAADEPLRVLNADSQTAARSVWRKSRAPGAGGYDAGLQSLVPE